MRDSKPDSSNLLILHKGTGRSASLSEASEDCPCKPRADLGAYLAIVVALAAYAGIAWLAGWLP